MAAIQMDFYSETLKRRVQINAVIPIDQRDHERPERPFRTLYLLHGMYDDNTGWITKSRVREIAEREHLAVIMPSGENSWYIDLPMLAGHDYGRFIGEELVEATRYIFPLSGKREDTYIGGLSMGGFGALRNGFKYHETFSKIIALSSGLRQFYGSPFVMNHSWNSYAPFGDLEKAAQSDLNPGWILDRLLEEKKNGADVQIPGIFLACGTEDSLIEANRSFRDALQAKNIPLTYYESPGIHDWNFWGDYIAKGIAWL